MYIYHKTKKTLKTIMLTGDLHKISYLLSLWVLKLFLLFYALLPAVLVSAVGLPSVAPHCKEKYLKKYDFLRHTTTHKKQIQS